LINFELCYTWKTFLKTSEACKAAGLQRNQSTKGWKTQFVDLSHLVNTREEPDL